MKVDSSSSSSTFQKSLSLLVGGQNEANTYFDRILTLMYENMLTAHKLLDIHVSMLHIKFLGIIASNIRGENEANHLSRG